MKNGIKNIMVALMLFNCVFGFSCNDTAASIPGNVVVSSTYNTLKVMQSGDYVPLGQKLDVIMYKGETESGQLIITPEKDIKSYELITEDLRLENDASVSFSKDKVKVYDQKYINVVTKTNNNKNENYPVGYTPDMLLPQELAVKYGENRIKAGMNQGVTVEFTTDSDTVAGVYTGNFVLRVDGKDFNIPVKLKVYDITVTKNYGKTCMVASAQYNMVGEYDTTKEAYKTYYEKSLNEYKFTLEYLPGSTDPVTMAESAVYYWNNPNFTSFDIPNSTYGSSIEEINTQLNLGNLYEYFYELGKASRPDMILFDKAYVYTKHVDEATSAKYSVVLKATEDIYSVEEKVFADLEKEGYFDESAASYPDYKAEFENSIKSVRIILTGDEVQAQNLGTGVHTYCSRIDAIQTPKQRHIFEEILEETSAVGAEHWFYTCESPVYPYPTHHIDDMLLGARVMRWMQKDRNLDGYLYWQTFSYSMWTGSETVTVDPYEDPKRFPSCNGDGFLAYPGKKYEADGYLPSIRLTTFRDGQEDYNLLCYFEELLKEKAEKYGLSESSVDSHLFLNDLYDSLYSGALVVDDDANFDGIKKSLLDLVEKNQSDTGFYITNDYSSDDVKSKIYVSDGYAVEVNGKEMSLSVCPNGKTCTVVNNYDKEVKLDIAIKKNGKTVETYDLYVHGEKQSVELSENVFDVSEGSDKKETVGGVDFVVVSRGEERKDILTFRPFVSLNTVLGDSVKLTDLESFTFGIKNTSEKSVTFTLVFKYGQSRYLLNKYTLSPNESRTITIDSISEYKTEFSRLAKATVEILFDNYYKDGEDIRKYEDRTIRVYDVSYVKARG